MLSIFPRTCWPHKSLENVYSGPLPVLKLDYLFFFAIELQVLYMLWILTPYQIHDLQMFFPFDRWSFHFVDGSFCWAEDFSLI